MNGLKNEMREKHCSKCDQTMGVENFYKYKRQKKVKYSTYCKPCDRIRQKERRKCNKKMPDDTYLNTKALSW